MGEGEISFIPNAEYCTFPFLEILHVETIPRFVSFFMGNCTLCGILEGP